MRFVCNLSDLHNLGYFVKTLYKTAHQSYHNKESYHKILTGMCYSFIYTTNGKK